MADIEMLEAPAQWNLPDVLIVEILCRSDSATVGRARALSSKWNHILTSFEFLQKSYKFNLERQHSLLMHVFFPNWTGDRNSIIRVDSKTGNRLFCTLPPEVHHCQNMEVVGIENGIVCIAYNMHGEIKQILIWNMLTQSSKIIPPPDYFGYTTTWHHVLALAYIPQTTTYCIVHAFKQNLFNGLLYYTVYSSATENWSEFVGLEGNLSRLSSEYVSMNDEVSWINYVADTYQTPDSVITYSVLGAGWRRLNIPEKCRARAHRLLNFKGKVSLASYPTARDQYALVVRSISQKTDGEDLITLTDDAEDDGTGLRQILILRIQESEDYLRRHLQCGRWPADLNIQSIAPHCQGLFPI
ncbi:hypothetical protein PIB30_090390 [Stylosanthes scabra]|uniref:F-box domain-containing protein n=1 Tax=Stylosanthes scabra TaxID=79078 RepID=A0ABU6QV17_9FABA|nr:hypothetical protein [Stylosanthes scabra]